MAGTGIFWFRRDLRLNDNPALLAAIAESDEIVLVFTLDPRQIEKLGEKGKAYLAQSLHLLDESLDNKLHVIAGNPLIVLKELSKKHNAKSVHIAASYEPIDSKEELEIESAGLKLVRTGSPYAVAPGRVRKPSDDTPYRVYTPFYKAWALHGWRKPADKPKSINAITPPDDARAFPDWKVPSGVKITPAGEAAALERFKYFQKNGLDDYDQARNLAGIDGTSKMSAHLTWGEIHPRTLLSPLGESKAHDVFRKEIAWREFYADVLFHNPHTETGYYARQFASMRYDKPGEKFKAWCEGKTGYPFVDAAMRQLLTEGWMHNRTRMVVASFLVKDLHLEWQLGERFFREHLVDYDVASNAHGWQWTAGCGTDASPYYRIFNPIEQGKRFDENGDYVRKYVPELAHIKGIEVQEPWEAADGYSKGYVKQIVDHKAERIESLARLEEIKVNKPAYPKD
jgi:deoxyribodipyrimidine photo-lyase